MGHKIILCVNERGILLASLCSGGRGLAAGGHGTRGSRLSSEKRVNTQPVCKPAGRAVEPGTAEAPATGGLGRPREDRGARGMGHGFDAGAGRMNLCLFLHPLCASDLSSGVGERVLVQHRCVCRREQWRFASRRTAWGFQW